MIVTDEIRPSGSKILKVHFKINIIQIDRVALFKRELDYYWTNIGYGYEQRPGA